MRLHAALALLAYHTDASGLYHPKGAGVPPLLRGADGGLRATVKVRLRTTSTFE